MDGNDHFLKVQEEESCKMIDVHPSKTDEVKPVKSSLKGDRGNFILLLLLYILQGLPVNISLAIPLILQMRGALYSEQAGFTIVTYPFLLKLLWAPIVDSVFISKFGRRKSWLIPTQYLIGIMLLVMSWNIDEWMGDEDKTRPPNLRMLIIICFVCNFMSATQDVAVDGWSLTMLRRENVGHSGTCNSIGFATSTLLGNTLFICLDSKDFCNRWLRTTPQAFGLVPFSHYTFFWAIVFFIVTTSILFFKKDNSLDMVEDEREVNLSFTESYSLFWKILRIKPVLLICLAMVTCRAGLGASLGVTPLKLIDAGINKDSIAVFNAPMTIIQIFIPLTVQRLLVGRKSLTGFIGLLPFRIVNVILLSLLVYFIPRFREDGQISTWYWLLVMTAFGLEMIAHYMMGLIGQAFFSKISDPRFGGTYLTLLNTIFNLGFRWPVSVSLALTDSLTWRKCPQKGCDIIVDGYYVEMAVGIFITILWYIWAKKKVQPLEELNDSSWAVQYPKKNDKSLHEILPV